MAIGTYVALGIVSVASLGNLKPDSALWGVFNLIQIIRTILLLSVEIP